MALQNVEANITLDLYNHDTTPATVKAIQLDSETRYVAARLQNVGVQYDVDSEATVQLIVVRPDKVGVQITGTTFTYGEEGAQFLGPYAELTQAALAVNGKMRGQFKITSGNQILRTEIFAISNGEALDASTDEWADEYDGYNLEEMATSIETNTDDIAALEADVEQIKEDLDSLFITDSINGAVAHFVDGADDIPMKSVKVNIAPVQSGSGDPSPSNVRPISGWNAVKVTRAGKNLIPKYVVNPPLYNGVTFTVNSDGSVSVNGTASATCNASSADITGIGGEVTLSGCPSGGSSTTYQLWIFDRTANASTTIVDTGNGSTGTLIKDHVYSVRIRIQRGYTVDKTFYPMLRLASNTDDTYEPYNGKDYNISLSSAGTVYGGTLDVMSGELTVDRKSILVDGTQDIRASQVQRFFVSIADAREITIENQGTDASVISERFKSYTWSGLAQATGCAPVYGFGIAFRDPAITTVSEWKEFFRNNPTRFVYMLANPITYNLTPTEVKSLLGINNIWSDAGDVTAEYRADTKLYIKRLTDSDTDMIADANITSGQYFMVGNDLYKATVNIASGAQVIEGTNATKVSLSEALNQIKEA